MRLTLFLFLIFIFSSGPGLWAKTDSTAGKPVVYSLEFKGLKRTRTSFARQMVHVKPGDLLDSAKLKADIQMLIRLPSVAHAYYQIFRSHENQYRVFYNVEENFTLLPTFNIWTVGDRLWWYTGLSEYNFLGRNILLEGFYRNNGKHSYGINFKAPFLWEAKWGVAATYKHLVSDEPVYFGETTAIYEYKNTSFELLGLYQWNFNNRLELGGSLFREEYSYIEGGEGIENKPERLLQNKWLVKLNHQYYRVDQYYQYLSGIVNSFNFQTVMTVNDPQPAFNIFWNEWTCYRRLGKKGNFAGRFRLGFSTNNDSPFSAFVVDNHVNIRGVGDRVDRGSAVITLNSEYRNTLWEKDWAAVQGVGFIDYGSWRQPGGGLDDFSKAANIYVYSGGGMRFILKKVYNATLRIDYGVGLTAANNSQGWVLGLGQYF